MTTGGNDKAQLQMRAVVFDEPGDESVLHMSSVEVPKMTPKQLRIKVEAAGINRADLVQREGNYPIPPGASPILGLELAGTILEIGPEVSGEWKVGERVMALCSGGTYAEQAVVDAGTVMRIPDGFTTLEAAAFMEATLTAYLNIFQLGGAEKGKSVLVHGGGSGVGSQAIALCKVKGITTFVTAGSDEKCKLCLERGASFVINYKSENFADAVNHLTKGKGVDIILDCVGAPYLQKDLECLATDGRIVYIGCMGGAIAEKVDIWGLMRKRASLIGSTLRSRSEPFKAALVAGLRDSFMEEMKHCAALKPAVDKVFPFEAAGDAHRRMMGSTHFGKIVLAWTL